ncbi:hypothetical protein KIPB_015332, partial [Kipferlia bialata]|eukprot:g15332.t1
MGLSNVQAEGMNTPASIILPPSGNSTVAEPDGEEGSENMVTEYFSATGCTGTYASAAVSSYNGTPTGT